MTAPSSATRPVPPRTDALFSKTWTFFEGDWHEGNVPLLGPRTHGLWMGSLVFDGARAYEGVTPDLDLHMARINRSAANFRLDARVPVETWLGLAAEGLTRFDREAALYIRPMYWAETGAVGGVRHDAASTRWCLCIYEAPMPTPGPLAITHSPYRRPTAESAPVDAKASCLYPNNARALLEARDRGFDNCLMDDALGNVAELGTANIFMAKDGVVFTPYPNGTFLAGITRARVIGLLRAAGVTVIEATLTYRDFLTADEIFSTGNFSKVSLVTRIDDRELPRGPMFEKARDLYRAFAHDTRGAST